VELDNR